jgi:hypothetical protein
MTATSDPRPPGALTAEQHRRFQRDGFFVVESVLTTGELDTLLAVVDEAAGAARRQRGLPEHAPVRVNHIVGRHPAFRRLLDHPAVLPLVVGVLGTNIQLRASNLDVRPPAPDAPDPDDFARHWHRDEPAGGWPTVDGVVPFLELKVGYFLTDLTPPGSGALQILPGSHRLAGPGQPEPQGRPEPVEVAVPPGAVLVFRTSLLHTAGPNHSDRTRRCLYLAYQHRWLRPSDYLSVPAQLLAQCNPVQRQLLGAAATPLKDPDVEPCSTYWTPTPADLPLRAWAQRHNLTTDQPGDHDVSTGREVARAR